MGGGPGDTECHGLGLLSASACTGPRGTSGHRKGRASGPKSISPPMRGFLGILLWAPRASGLSAGPQQRGWSLRSGSKKCSRSSLAKAAGGRPTLPWACTVDGVCTGLRAGQARLHQHWGARPHSDGGGRQRRTPVPVQWWVTYERGSLGGRGQPAPRLLQAIPRYPPDGNPA